MTDEREDLESLIAHPGWLRVVRYATEEWQERMNQHLRSAAGDPDDVVALRKIQQVLVAQEAILRLIKWPEDRVRQLPANPPASAVVDFSRRGTL